MSVKAPTSVQTEQIVTGRLLWLGPLTVIISVVANVIIWLIAKAVLNIPPRFAPLADPGSVIVLTIIGVTGAVIVFAIVSRFARHPIKLFRIIALVVLLLSFLPDIGLLTIPGMSTPAVIVLMLMHVVAAAISVGLLTNLSREK